MKVRQHLQVSAEAFFAEIITSVCADIQRETKKHIRLTTLEKGFSYTKYLAKRSAKNAEVKVKILECMPNSRYRASFTSQIDITVVSYEIEALNNCEIAVTYEETYELKEPYQLKHRFFKNALLDKDAKKRGIKLLKHIEHCIIKQQKAGVV